MSHSRENGNSTKFKDSLYAALEGAMFGAASAVVFSAINHLRGADAGNDPETAAEILALGGFIYKFATGGIIKKKFTLNLVQDDVTGRTCLRTHSKFNLQLARAHYMRAEELQKEFEENARMAAELEKQPEQVAHHPDANAVPPPVMTVTDTDNMLKSPAPQKMVPTLTFPKDGDAGKPNPRKARSQLAIMKKLNNDMPPLEEDSTQKADHKTSHLAVPGSHADPHGEKGQPKRTWSALALPVTQKQYDELKSDITSREVKINVVETVIGAVVGFGLFSGAMYLLGKDNDISVKELAVGGAIAAAGYTVVKNNI